MTATAANAASILEKIYQAKELPFDWVKMSRTLSPDNWDPQNKIVPIDPVTHWGTQPGKDKLNKAYADSGWQSQLDEVTKLYADHYKSGPVPLSMTTMWRAASDGPGSTTDGRRLSFMRSRSPIPASRRSMGSASA